MALTPALLIPIEDETVGAMALLLARRRRIVDDGVLVLTEGVRCGAVVDEEDDEAVDETDEE